MIAAGRPSFSQDFFDSKPIVRLADGLGAYSRPSTKASAVGRLDMETTAAYSASTHKARHPNQVRRRARALFERPEQLVRFSMLSLALREQRICWLRNGLKCNPVVQQGKHTDDDDPTSLSWSAELG